MTQALPIPEAFCRVLPLPWGLPIMVSRGWQQTQASHLHPEAAPKAETYGVTFLRRSFSEVLQHISPHNTGWDLVKGPLWNQPQLGGWAQTRHDSPLGLGLEPLSPESHERREGVVGGKGAGVGGRLLAESELCQRKTTGWSGWRDDHRQHLLHPLWGCLFHQDSFPRSGVPSLPG